MAVKKGLLTNRTPATLLLLTAVIAVVMLGSTADVFSQQNVLGADSPLSFEVAVSPWVSTPGDKVSLYLSLSNNGLSASMPDVTIHLPDEVVPDVSNLPPGTNYNFQTGALSWQPYLEPLGGASQIEIWMSVKVVQIGEAERTITIDIRDDSVEWSETATMWIGSKPQAFIVFDPPQVAVGQPVRLVANTSGTGPMTQVWSLDDGRVVAASDPEVVFPSAGLQLVSLQISNPLGSSVASGRIEVLPQPISQFTIEDNSTVADTAITFVNESGGEPPLSYAWTFGDGSTSNEENPVNHYSAPGLYQVNLKVENAYGQSESTSFVDIGRTPEIEVLIADYQEVGNIVQGRVVATNPTTEFSWDMGDGRHYTGTDMKHQYWATGDYIVTVTARNDYGETRVSRWIRIGYSILHYNLPLLTNSSASDAGLNTDFNLDPLDGVINIGLGPIPELSPIDFAPGTSPVEQLFIYINEARGLYNLRSLTYVHSLSVAAQAHTDDMAGHSFTAHVGSDGSTPAYRLQLAGYNGGYGGEATAWGMSDPIEPIEFWLTSPPHRAILLNPAVSEVGLGFTVNYDSPNIWYWTAEFASLNLPVVGAAPPQEPVMAPTFELLLLGPPQSSEFLLSDNAKLIFSWSWGGGIQENQRFALYLTSGGRTFQAGVLRQSQSTGQYQFSVDASSIAISPGLYSWQVKLEDSGQGIVVEESPIWQVRFAQASQATAQPAPPAAVTPTPNSVPTMPPADDPTSAQGSIPVATPLPTPTP